MRFAKLSLIGLAGILLLAALGMVAVLAWRAKLQHDVRAAHAISTPGGIDVIERPTIGGIPQVVRIRGKSLANPVLLFLHGGPGTPMMPFADAFEGPLDSAFTVVMWDQRGAGLTAKLSDQSQISRGMSMQRMNADVIELTDYLRRRFHKDRIVLMGHSWGSILGLPLAYAHPERFEAFIGVGQVIDVRRNEALGYARDLLLAEKMGITRAVRELRAIAPYPPAGVWRGEHLDVRHDWNEYFGESVFGYQSMAKAMLRYAWASPDYSVLDVYHLITASDDVYDNLDLYIHSFKAIDSGTAWRIPAFFIMGRYDYQVNPELMQEYYGRITAPQKQLFFIERAAHAPMIERTQQFDDIVVSRIRPAILQAQVARTSSPSDSASTESAQ